MHADVFSCVIGTYLRKGLITSRGCEYEPTEKENKEEEISYSKMYITTKTTATATTTIITTTRAASISVR